MVLVHLPRVARELPGSHQEPPRTTTFRLRERERERAFEEAPGAPRTHRSREI